MEEQKWSEEGKECGAVVLLHGPDTAYYNIRPADRQFQPVRQELDQGLQEELEVLKARAQEQDAWVPTRWAFEGQVLFMRDKGGSQFRWILENDFLTLAIGRGKKTGIIGQARLSSEYLWRCGADLAEALSRLHLFLVQVYGEYFLLEQSALDLAADVIGVDFSAVNVKESFLSRAVYDEERPVVLDDGYVDGPCVIRRRWKKIAGLSFGRHTSVVSAVIYNKTDEIKYHSPQKRWFYDLWRRSALEQGVHFDESTTVWRVEVRFRREAFREFPDVSGAYDVLDHVRDLWTYAVGHAGGGKDGDPDGWLRYVEPSEGDTNRARWPVHPAWKVVQRAYDEESLPVVVQEPEQQEREACLRLVDEELEARPWRQVSKKKQALRRKQGLEAVPVSRAMDPSPVDEKPLDICLFIRRRKRQVNLEKAGEQIYGWLTTWEAWRRGYAVDRKGEAGVQDGRGESIEEVEGDITMTLHHYLEWVASYEQERLLVFGEEVRKKRVRDRLEAPRPEKRRRKRRQVA